MHPPTTTGPLGDVDDVDDDDDDDDVDNVDDESKCVEDDRNDDVPVHVHQNE